MFLVTTILNTIRERLAEKPAIKIRGTDGKVTRIKTPPSMTPKQMLESVRQHARIIRDANCGSHMQERTHSSVIIMDDGNFVTIWYGDHERD